MEGIRGKERGRFGGVEKDAVWREKKAICIFRESLLSPPPDLALHVCSKQCAVPSRKGGGEKKKREPAGSLRSGGGGGKGGER